MLHPEHVLSAALRHTPTHAALTSGHARLLVAGAGGVLGAEVLHRLVASGLFAHTDVLTTEPMTIALPRVGTAPAGVSDELPRWPVSPKPFDVAVVMFEPSRSFNDRERAFFTPRPDQLPALAAWLQRSGVHTLVVVLPHAPGRLPDALKRGLASLSEQTVAALGFDRVLLVRTAASRVPNAGQDHSSMLEKLASWMLSISAYMIPPTEQPVGPGRVAEFLEAALRVLPTGTFVASTDLLHRANRGSRKNRAAAITMDQVVHDWLTNPVIPQAAAAAPLA